MTLTFEKKQCFGKYPLYGADKFINPRRDKIGSASSSTQLVQSRCLGKLHVKVKCFCIRKFSSRSLINNFHHPTDIVRNAIAFERFNQEVFTRHDVRREHADVALVVFVMPERTGSACWNHVLFRLGFRYLVDCLLRDVTHQHDHFEIGKQ